MPPSSTVQQALLVQNPSADSLHITDTGAKIAANFDALNLLARTGKINSITVTGSASGTFAISAYSYINDSSLISILSFWSSGYKYAISGVTSANLSALKTSNALNSNITSLSFAPNQTISYEMYQVVKLKLASSTGLVVTVDVTNYMPASMDATMYQQPYVKFAYVNANSWDLARLGSDSRVVSISLSEYHTITYADYHSANGKITTSGLSIYMLSPQDAAAVAADSHVVQLYFAANSTFTAAQFTSAVESKNATSGLTITGVSVANAAAIAADPHVAHITLSSTTLTVAQYTRSGLNSVVAKNQTPNLTITGASIALANELYMDVDLNATHIQVVGAKAADLMCLTNPVLANISSISFADNTTISEEQYNFIKTKLAPSVHLTVNNLNNAADAAAIAADPNVSYLVLPSDPTAAQYTAAVASKNTLTGLHIDGVNPASAANLQADSHVAAFSVAGAHISDLTSILAMSKLTGVTVADTAANIQSGITQAFFNPHAGLISSLAVTDNQPLVIDLTGFATLQGMPNQYQYSQYVLLELLEHSLGLYPGFGATISGFSGVNLINVPSTPAFFQLVGPLFDYMLSGIGSNTPAPFNFSFSIQYLASDIPGELDSNQWLISWLNAHPLANVHFTGMSVIDPNNPIVLSHSQLTSDAGALALLTGPYQLLVTDVLAKDVASTVALSHTYLINIADTASHLSSYLYTVHANEMAINAITLTSDQSNPNNVITLEESQLARDASTLALIGSPYKLALTNVAAGDISTLLSADTGNHIYSVAIKDSSAHLNTALQSSLFSGLMNHGTTISSIQVTDTGDLSGCYASFHGVAVDALLDGTTGCAIFNFLPNQFAPFSATNMNMVYGWSGGDMINYSVALSAGGHHDPATQGLAQINATTGVATFNAADSTLAQQIAAVESAFSNPTAGQFAEWTNKNNTYVLITDGTHTGSGVGAYDVLVQLVGTTTAQVQLINGHLSTGHIIPG